MEKKTFAIEGMTCSSCAQTVETMTQKLNGGIKASVNLVTEKLSVEYDDSIVTDDDIKKSVSNSGYAVAENKMKKIRIKNSKELNE